MPIGLLAGAAIAAGAAKVGSNIAQGIGTARAAKKAFTDKEQEELAELERRRKSGDLGLTGQQLQAIEQRALAARAGAARQREAQQLQTTAQEGLGGPVSGRDIFLREQAAAAAELGDRQQQNLAIQQAEADAEAINVARMRDLQQQEENVAVARVEGFTQAIGGGIAGAGEAASAGMSASADMKMREAALGAQPDEALLNQYNQGAPAANPYSNYV